MTSDWLFYWIGYLLIPVTCSLIVVFIVAGRAVKTKTFWLMMPIGAFVIVPVIAILTGAGLVLGLPFTIFWGWFIRRIALASEDQTHRDNDVPSILGKK